MLKEAEKFRLNIINNYKKYLGNSYITLTLKKNANNNRWL